MKATFVKVVEPYDGRAEVFRMDPPIEYSQWSLEADAEVVKLADLVCASALVVDGTGETFLFHCDEQGEFLCWNELPGSRRGTLDIDAVLSAAGYEVVRPNPERTRVVAHVQHEIRAAEKHQTAPVVIETLRELLKRIESGEVAT